MRYDTAGNPIYEPIYYNCCRIDTAGNHEWNCPNNPNNSIKPLPERLTNTFYGKEILDEQIKKRAKNAPGIEKIRKITKNLPSLTKMLLEGRGSE